MLSVAAPAGTMGKTISWWGTTNSISAGRSVTAQAASMAASASAGVDARKAAQPKASARATKSGLVSERSVWL